MQDAEVRRAFLGQDVTETRLEKFVKEVSRGQALGAEAGVTAIKEIESCRATGNCVILTALFSPRWEVG